jgi:hypothetical protein
MLISKITALVLAGVILANCASSSDEEGFCRRNTGLCVVAGIIVVAAVAAVVIEGAALAEINSASDIRLKRNVVPVATLPNGLQLYSFRYWNDDRTFVGVLAQDLLADGRFRHAVSTSENGYYLVNLGALGLGVTGSSEEFFEASQRAIVEAEPIAN